tara:strand:- start:1595 stop:3193 length:1599 start_codon:yes stop_codon:yes gene_type:complete
MGWSFGFKSALAKAQIAPSYTLRLYDLRRNVSFSISTTGNLAIDKEGPTINGQRCIPGKSFNISFGGFSVPLAGDISSLFPAVRKGCMGELLCSIAGQEERMAYGQLRNIRKTFNKFRLEFVDLLTAMGSNFNTAPAGGTASDPDPFKLFYSTGIPVSPTSNWVAGAGAPFNFPTQLDLDDVTPFVKEFGEFGIVRCVPSSGVEFYLKYDSVTVTSAPAGYLTLSHTYNVLSKIYPSKNVPTAITTSDFVYPSVFLKGWPGDIFGKLMISTDGTGSGFNDYPQRMNSGIGLDSSFYDAIDSNAQKSILKGSSNAYDIGHVVDAPYSSGWRQIISSFATAGHWPVWRQNSLSYRAARDPITGSTQTKITDSDIVSLISHDLFSPDQQNIFYRSQITYSDVAGASGYISSTTLNPSATSFPIQSNQERDLTNVLGYSWFTDLTKRANLATGDMKRMRTWDQVTYEKIQLQVTLPYCALACGDVVWLQSAILYGVNEAGQGQTYNRRAMVIGLDFNISQMKTVITLAIPNYQSIN